jgi:hypothetical protein
MFTIIPGLLSAQNYESGFDLLYSKLNEEQLHTQLQRVNTEILTSSLVSTGGIVFAGLGALASYAGIIMITSEPIIDFDPDDEFQMMMWPLVLSIYVLQYGGGFALITGGVGLSVTGVGLTISASGNIAFQFDKRRQIQLELKRFQPTSYKDTPGMGIGLSIPIE